MSTYSSTVTVTGVESDVDVYKPTVTVARNNLDTTAGDKVRLNTVHADGGEGAIYLDTEAAEALAVAILEAAGLVTATSPIGGNRFPTMRASDAALNKVRDAVTAAREHGNTPGSILARVADGLTGRLAGHVERAAGIRMAVEFEAVVATPVEVLRAEEHAAAAAREAARAARVRRQADGWEA